MWYICGVCTFNMNKERLHVVWFLRLSADILKHLDAISSLNKRAGATSEELFSEQQSERSLSITMDLVLSILCGSFILACIPGCFSGGHALNTE